MESDLGMGSTGRRSATVVDYMRLPEDNISEDDGYQASGMWRRITRLLNITKYRRGRIPRRIVEPVRVPSNREIGKHRN